MERGLPGVWQHSSSLFSSGPVVFIGLDWCSLCWESHHPSGIFDNYPGAFGAGRPLVVFPGRPHPRWEGASQSLQTPVSQPWGGIGHTPRDGRDEFFGVFSGVPVKQKGEWGVPTMENVLERGSITQAIGPAGMVREGELPTPSSMLSVCCAMLRCM